MFVRTIYATGDPAKIDAAVDRISAEWRDHLSAQPGFRGFGMFVDRELGKLLTGTWWETEKNREDSNDRLREWRSSLLENFAATVSIENYEAAVLHRVRPPGPGACFRLTRLDFHPADADLLIDTYRTTALHKLETIHGLVGASLFIDRTLGRGTASTIFSDRAALVASRAAQSSVRAESTAKAHVTVRSIEEFDVVVAEVTPG